MQTYKGRTKEEQQAFNAERRKRYQEEKLLKEQGLLVESETVTVDTSTIQEAARLTLKERLFAKSQAPAEKEEKKVDKKRLDNTEKLISNVLPLTISAMIAINAEKMLQEPYKKCAPTREEVSSILNPVFSLISRQIEITGKASQNAIDIATALLAALTVSTRIAIEMMEIKRHERTRDHNESRRTDQRTSTSNNGYYHDETVARPNGQESSNGANVRVDVADGASEQRTEEAELVHQLMLRDRQGRARLGLAPWTDV